MSMRSRHVEVVYWQLIFAFATAFLLPCRNAHRWKHHVCPAAGIALQIPGCLGHLALPQLGQQDLID
jgi:hypothetical protein